MEINEQVEDRVRDAIAAAIGRDGEALQAAWEGLDEEQFRHAMSLVYFAVGYVVNETHNNQPSPESLRSLADQIVSSESRWIRLSVEEVLSLLTSASQGVVELPGVNPGDVPGLTSVVAGYLLAAFRRAEEGEEWNDYLDEVWAALLAVPDPSGT